MQFRKTGLEGKQVLKPTEYVQLLFEKTNLQIC